MSDVILPDNHDDRLRVSRHLNAYLRGYEGHYKTYNKPETSYMTRLSPVREEVERTLWEASLEENGSDIVSFCLNRVALEKANNETPQKWFDCLKDMIAHYPGERYQESQIEYPALIYVMNKLDEFAQTPETFSQRLLQFNQDYQKALQQSYTIK